MREAINRANVDGLRDVIHFAVGSGPVSINLRSAMPTLTGPVVIDGTTQPGYSGTPIIEMNGAAAGASADGLRITSGGTTVRGLVINRFGGEGIEVSSGGGNVIRGNYIG